MAGSRLFIWLLGLASLSLLFFLGHLNPIAYLFMSAWLPLPILLVGWRAGNIPALILAALGAGLLFLGQPGAASLSELMGFGELLLMGLLLSVFHSRGFPAASTITFTVGLIVLATGLVVAGQSVFAGVSPLELLSRKAAETANTLTQVLKDTGAGTQGFALMGLSQVDWQALILQVLPALLVINTTFVTWLNLLAARAAARGFRWEGPELPLCEWSNPEWLIFLFLGAGFLFLVPYQAARLVSLNLLLILGLLYFFQGLAVMAAIYQRLRLPWFLKLLGYALLFMNPLFVLVIALGLLDLWLDFRRLNQPLES